MELHTYPAAPPTPGTGMELAGGVKSSGIGEGEGAGAHSDAADLGAGAEGSGHGGGEGCVWVDDGGGHWTAGASEGTGAGTPEVPWVRDDDGGGPAAPDARGGKGDATASAAKGPEGRGAAVRSLVAAITASAGQARAECLVSAPVCPVPAPQVPRCAQGTLVLGAHTTSAHTRWHGLVDLP